MNCLLNISLSTNLNAVLIFASTELVFLNIILLSWQQVRDNVYSKDSLTCRFLQPISCITYSYQGLTSLWPILIKEHLLGLCINHLSQPLWSLSKSPFLNLMQSFIISLTSWPLDCLVSHSHEPRWATVLEQKPVALRWWPLSIVRHFLWHVFFVPFPSRIIYILMGYPSYFRPDNPISYLLYDKSFLAIQVQKNPPNLSSLLSKIRALLQKSKRFVTHDPLSLKLCCLSLKWFLFHIKSREFYINGTSLLENSLQPYNFID